MFKYFRSMLVGITSVLFLTAITHAATIGSGSVSGGVLTVTVTPNVANQEIHIAVFNQAGTVFKAYGEKTAVGVANVVFMLTPFTGQSFGAFDNIYAAAAGAPAPKDCASLNIALTVIDSPCPGGATMPANGACCGFPGTPQCDEVPEEHCDAVGGDFRGDGSSCQDEQCPTVSPLGIAVMAALVVGAGFVVARRRMLSQS